MEKLTKKDLSSLDITDHQLAKLHELFPEVFTEGNKIDWDRLRSTLGHHIDTGKERFGMQWPGKADCFRTIQQPSIATLLPDRDQSIDFDTTENVFIEGDNLEVLKLLQKSYLGKIKMIYIDPPYNTGKEFIYPDNYSESLDTYLTFTQQTDDQGRRWATNTDTDGRYHSKWMSMMYPRLFLARNLLKDDGVIFISIDDHEQTHLRKICDEIFGEENLLVHFVWKTDGNFDNQAKVKNCHEYVIAYCRNLSEFPHPPTIDLAIDGNSKLFNEEIRNTIVKNGKANPISQIELPIGFPVEFEGGQIIERTDKWPRYLNTAKIKNYKLQNNTIIESGWSSKELLQEFIKNDFQSIVDIKGQETTFLISQTGSIEVIKKRKKDQSHVISVLSNVGNTQVTSAYLKRENIYFEFPKPPQLIKYLATMNSGENYLILDFFAGSATTAHAVIELNKEDGGHRKYICVQIPEPTDPDSEAYKAGYRTIADISKERIRRVSAKIQRELDDKKTAQAATIFGAEDSASLDIDLGMKVFKLAPSNFSLWDASYTEDTNTIQSRLFNHIDHIADTAGMDALVYELLLKSGYMLTCPMKTIDINGLKVYDIEDRSILICLEKKINHELLLAMAELEPSRVICLDEAFTSEDADALKTNAVQIMKSKGVVFRTI